MRDDDLKVGCLALFVVLVFLLIANRVMVNDRRLDRIESTIGVGE
jgi:hypothetical protein